MKGLDRGKSLESVDTDWWDKQFMKLDLTLFLIASGAQEEQ